jgi:hypothetical protein
MDWQTLEESIRKLAEAIWAANARPETVAGVKCDIVLKIRPDYWVLVEVTKRDDLAKLREDLSKLTIMKLALLSQSIFAECYFVTEKNHTSLVESARSAKIEVHSPLSFANKFIGTTAYAHERSLRPFGSAVDPDSGLKDVAAYTPTKYLRDDGKEYRLEDIEEALRYGKKIVLVGEFGTGKSR